MSNFITLIKKNLLEAFRTKKILIFIGVFLAIGIISPVTAKVLPRIFEALLDSLENMGVQGISIFDGTVADSYAQFISNNAELGVLFISLMYVGTIIKEKEKGTYAMLKTSKVKDSEIVLAHYVSQVIVFTISYLLSVASFVVLNIVLFRQIMGVRGLVVLAYIYLISLVALAFTLFVSCVVKSRGQGYLIVVLGYFIIYFLEIIPKINIINPFHLFTLSSSLVSNKNYILKDNLLTAGITLIWGILLVLVSLYLVKNRIDNRRNDQINEDNSEGVRKV